MEQRQTCGFIVSAAREVESNVLNFDVKLNGLEVFKEELERIRQSVAEVKAEFLRARLNLSADEFTTGVSKPAKKRPKAKAK
jgi:hypothetical protein